MKNRILLGLAALFSICFMINVVHARNEIIFITDLEGKGSKWNQFIEQHPGLLVRDAKGRITFVGNGRLIFGGDVFDQGPNSMQLAKEFLALKTTYPEQVILLAGNRDINKMRFFWEINHPDFLKRKIGDSMMPVAQDYSAFLTQEKQDDSYARRLKWIFEKSMGAGKAFEFHREEMATDRLKADGAALTPESIAAAMEKISDAQVAENYLAFMSPAGTLASYLENCQLVYIHSQLDREKGTIRNTLFQHGAPSAENIGMAPEARRPGVPATFEKLMDAKTWENRMNSWYRSEVSAWKRSSRFRQDPMSRPGDDLINYIAPAHPNKSPEANLFSRHSIVASKFSNLGTGNPEDPAREVDEYSRENGILRIVVGHTPHGNMCVVTRGQNVIVVGCDTTDSPRVSTVTLESNGSLRLRGVEAVESERGIGYSSLNVRLDVEGNPSYLGKRTSSGFLAIGKNPNGKVVLYKNSGPPAWKAIQQYATPEEMRALGIDPFEY